MHASLYRHVNVLQYFDCQYLMVSLSTSMQHANIQLDGRGGNLKGHMQPIASCPNGSEGGSVMQMDTKNNDHLLTISVTFSGLTNGIYVITTGVIDALIPAIN